MMKKYTPKERKNLWIKIIALFNDKTDIEPRLTKIITQKNIEVCFKKFDDIYDLLENYDEFQNPNIEKIILTLLDTFEELNYFITHIKDKGHYDYRRISKKYNEIKEFLVSNSEISLKVPQHPNDIYRNTFYELKNKYNLTHNLSADILNTLFHKKKVPPRTKNLQRETQNIFTIFDSIINNAENSKNLSKEEIENQRQQLNNLKKLLQ